MFKEIANHEIEVLQKALEYFEYGIESGEYLDYSEPTDQYFTGSKILRQKLADPTQKYDSNTLKQLRNRFRGSGNLCVVLGAGDVWYGHDWIATNQEDLDILVCEDWEYFFKDKRADLIVAEHVWEHFTEEQALIGLRNVHAFLKHTGTFRIAVPDGHFPNPDYIDRVKPGGTGAGADDHKVLYTIETLLELLDKVPFRTTALEYFDKDGKFHYKDWNPLKGQISRSRFFDDRNTENEINYTSIIIDCKK